MTGCSTTKKVPDGQYLLTKNEFEYKDKKLFKDRIPEYVIQRPKSKIVPTRQWIYNLANAKYDTILTEYMTFPNNMRNKKLRDSLYIKHNHPEYVGKSLFFNRVFHTLGRPPLIWDPNKTSSSSENIRKFLVYKGYWDASTTYQNDLDSTAKKAKNKFSITFNDPTFIKSYGHNISDPQIREIYTNNSKNSFIKEGNILDQEMIEKEIKRLNDLMKSKGYYNFNAANSEIFFTADTLTSRKQVPLMMDIQKEGKDSIYRVTTIGNVEVVLLEDPTKNTKEDIQKLDSLNLRGIIIRKPNDQYKNRALWFPIVLKRGAIYNQNELDQTKRNFMSTNNFSMQKTELTLGKGENDSILSIKYFLTPLPKHEIKLASDFHYSQILNFGFSPSIDYTTRNIFRRAENLTMSLSGIVGTTNNGKNPNSLFNAYEVSAQTKLTFPRLLLPFRYNRLIPKKYSPSSSINMGASIQNNIGLGRINFNTGLDYNMNLREGKISHRLSLFDTQFSLTRNKDSYYDFFPADKLVRDEIFNYYFVYDPNTGNQYNGGNLSSDDVSYRIINDENFINTLTPAQRDHLYIFEQSLLNKARQTQDVVVSSLTYNYVFNETGDKNIKNPIYLSAKVELAGNLLDLLSKSSETNELTNTTTKKLFGVHFAQFAKFDIDFRKYFSFGGKKNLIFRQFIGIGIPYGNSETMPFIRSYYNGGSYDIRAWKAFDGLGPGASQLDQRVRSYMMGNIKLTTNLEYRFAINDMFEGAIFTDAGNIWNLREDNHGEKFAFNSFLSEMGVGSGFGIRINIAYVVARLDFAYKIYDPNQPKGEKWQFSNFNPFKPTFNLAFGYPF